jgi:hypothetical protein
MHIFMQSLLLRVSDVAESIKQIGRHLVRAIWLEPSTGRVRATVDTVTTVTTCATCTTLSQVAGYDAKQGLTNAIERVNWGINVRARIT